MFSQYILLCIQDPAGGHGTAVTQWGGVGWTSRLSVHMRPWRSRKEPGVGPGPPIILLLLVPLDRVEPTSVHLELIYISSGGQAMGRVMATKEYMLSTKILNI